MGNLEKRVVSLESKLKKRDWVDVVGALSPFATAVVVLLLGIALKDSVQMALTREQLHLTSVSGMQELLLSLRKPESKEAAVTAAMTLAAYGHYAIPSLMTTLNSADDVMAPAAEQGLEAVAASEPEAVCNRLQTEISRRSGRHHYTTHIAALRLMGIIPCTAASASVAAYKREVDLLTTPEAVDGFGKGFSAALTADNLQELKDQLAETSGLLSQKPGVR